MPLRGHATCRAVSWTANPLSGKRAGMPAARQFHTTRSLTMSQRPHALLAALTISALAALAACKKQEPANPPANDNAAAASTPDTTAATGSMASSAATDSMSSSGAMSGAPSASGASAP
jgi:hypothetical protein